MEAGPAATKGTGVKITYGNSADGNLRRFSAQIEILESLTVSGIGDGSRATRGKLMTVFLDKTDRILFPHVIEGTAGEVFHQNIPGNDTAVGGAYLHADIEIIEMEPVERRRIECNPVEQVTPDGEKESVNRNHLGVLLVPRKNGEIVDTAPVKFMNHVTVNIGAPRGDPGGIVGKEVLGSGNPDEPHRRIVELREELLSPVILREKNVLMGKNDIPARCPADALVVGTRLSIRRYSAGTTPTVFLTLRS